MDVSRRDLFKSGAVIGGGLAATAALGFYGCSNEQAGDGQQTGAKRSGEPEEWTYTADVVIAGFGAAGMGAAVKANELGLTAIVLEKEPPETAGGDLSCCGGNFSPMKPEVLEAESFGGFSKAFSEKLSSEALKMGDLVQELVGDQMIQGSEKYGPEYRAIPAGGYIGYNALVEHIAGLDNVTVLYEHPVTEVVRDLDNGEVLGFKATDASGKDVYVKGSLGSLIATGGYASNKELVNGFLYPRIEFNSEGGPSIAGDGLALAGSCGAYIGDMTQRYRGGLCYKTPSDQYGSAFRAIGAPKMIWVNREGKRFMDEKSLGELIYSPALLDFVPNDYPNLPCWGVFDSATLDKGPLGVGESWAVTWSRVHDGYIWSSDNKKEIEAGWILQADTLEELAAKMKSKSLITGEEVTVDAAGLAEQIARYNADYEAGGDSQFGTTVDTMTPLLTPPFYAIELQISSGYTMGGLRTNDDSQVLTFENEPINRLYAAGNLSQGIYPTKGGIFSIGIQGCWARGGMAVQHASTLQAWDA